jgi:phenylalanyl-tRNA synthetase beta chain
MLISIEWLQEWVAAELNPEALANELTTAGLEVDAVLPAAASFEGVVVARVVDVQPLPDADRLRLCQVDDGAGTHQVVCGAANVTTGMLAAYARVGARLPDGQRIRAAKLRGTHSAGMLCSARELGLAEGAEGLIVLDADAPLGTDLREYLKLDDTILDVDLTPNRGDCFSLLGIAREVAARRGATPHNPAAQQIVAASEERFAVELIEPDACPRFAGRIIRGVRAGGQAPLWMRERLRRAGVRAISPIVDVTNYVMLELGQPLHAYDLAKLSGGIRVRFASGGERLVLLDEREVALDDDVLVIADDTGPIGLAGVMGGAGTAVTGQTTDVFLEAAHFAPGAITGRARRFGLHTDASTRFERGVDPQMPARAIERATQLLVGICGGTPGPVTVTEQRDRIAGPRPITLRSARVQSVLGMPIDSKRIESVLRSLQMQVQPAADGWQVTAPSHRFDIGIEEDLIEEVGRMIGYDNIPIVPGAGGAALGTASEIRVDEDRVADVLVARGYTEVVTYSFVDQALEDLVNPGAIPVRLANPIASDLAVMRRSLWPGLLQVARQNLSRQQTRLRMFEIGSQFQARGDGDGDSVVESSVVAGIAVGSREPEHWSALREEVDFYDVKGDLEALIALTGRSGTLAFRAADHPALKPGETARIALDGDDVGWLGVAHPRVARAFDIRGAAVLFALQRELTFAAKVPRFTPYSRYPHVRRDLAVVVDDEVSVEALVKLAREACGELLQRAVVFDVYRGKGIDSSRKSVALGLILQDASRTLTDADADDALQSVARLLQSQLGATIRT